MNFCTYFDYGYLTRGLALYSSLEAHCDEFTLWILCLDNACEEQIRRLSLVNVNVITLAELEGADSGVRECRENRSYTEFCYTMSSVLCHHILESNAGIDVLCYLDSDLYFFSSPRAIWDEFGSYSIGIIEHRFPAGREWLNRYGRYNVGLIVFKRDTEGRSCAKRWRDQCVEWCYGRIEEGKYADQKYLDEWPQRYSRVIVLQNLGLNLAPWNVGGVTISVRGGRPFADDVPVVFFHFHGLCHVWHRLYKCNFSQELVAPTRVAKRSLVIPYVECLRSLHSQLGVPEPSVLDFIRKSCGFTGAVRLVRSIWLRDYVSVPRP